MPTMSSTANGTSWWSVPMINACSSSFLTFWRLWVEFAKAEQPISFLAYHPLFYITKPWGHNKCVFACSVHKCACVIGKTPWICPCIALVGGPSPYVLGDVTTSRPHLQFCHVCQSMYLWMCASRKDIVPRVSTNCVSLIRCEICLLL